MTSSDGADDVRFDSDPDSLINCIQDLFNPSVPPPPPSSPSPTSLTFPPFHHLHWLPHQQASSSSPSRWPEMEIDVPETMTHPSFDPDGEIWARNPGYDVTNYFPGAEGGEEDGEEGPNPGGLHLLPPPQSREELLEFGSWDSYLSGGHVDSSTSGNHGNHDAAVVARGNAGILLNDDFYVDDRNTGSDLDPCWQMDPEICSHVEPGSETFLPEHSGFLIGKIHLRSGKETGSMHHPLIQIGGTDRRRLRLPSDRDLLELRDGMTLQGQRSKRSRGVENSPRSSFGRGQVNECTGQSLMNEFHIPADVDGVTEVTESRVLRRREQNRRAARTCRERKRALSESMIKEYQELLSSNTNLRCEIRQLQEEEQDLTSVLNKHLQLCTNMTSSSSPFSLPPPCALPGTSFHNSQS